jgi:acetyltransferase
MMEQTKIYKALEGVRGREAVDLVALEQLLVRFSQLVAEQKWIKEIDINPLLASSDRLLALDARVVLHEPDTEEADLPVAAIRPYPTQYAAAWATKDGMDVMIRPIRPEDEPLLVAFHEGLSERSVYLRYFRSLKLSQRVAHERLARICFIDYDREMALVVDYQDPKTKTHEILGVGRLTKVYGTRAAEFAVLVTDRLQGQGVGHELLRRLVEVARHEKMELLVGDILPENVGMLDLCTTLGFRCEYMEKDEVVRAELRL